MADEKNKNKQNKPNNPFGSFNSNKKNDGKGPKFNAYWIYGIIAIVFIIIQFYFSNTRGPVDTNWSDVKSKMLVNQDIERIVVVNEKQANIYIKKDRLEKYKQEFSGNFAQPSDEGPHFTFNIGSVETFERNLREAQEGI